MSRKVQLEVEIKAPATAVWKAISTGEELRRWFPLDAAVEPGIGGSVTLSWGPDCEGTSHIDVWEPGERLVWSEEWGADEEGSGPVRVAVDFRIESRGGATVLRLVHSGFGDGESWDDYVDTVDSGWRYFLFNLRHYLERHAGHDRRMVWTRQKLARPRGEVWRRLLEVHGLDPDQEVVAGAPASLWGEFPAIVVRSKPAIHLVLSVAELDDAPLLVEIEPGEGGASVGTWLSLYGGARAHAERLQRRLADVYTRRLVPA